MKPHPTNPRGVLVPCAGGCGRELHIPRSEVERNSGERWCVRCGADRFLTGWWDKDPCDCGQVQGPNGGFVPHSVGAPGCEIQSTEGEEQ